MLEGDLVFLVFAILAYLGLFLIGVYITRWIFGISKIITALQEQVRLLTELLKETKAKN